MIVLFYLPIFIRRVLKCLFWKAYTMHTINLVVILHVSWLQTILGTTVLENMVIRNGKKHSCSKVSNNYLESLTQEDHNIHLHSLFCLVFLVVENSRKPLLIVTHPGLFIFSFLTKERKSKNNKKEKFHTLFFNMKWSIEMK